MKKYILIFVCIVGFLSSCSDKFDVESIDFKVELLDDVSPVKVRCTVEGDWDYVRWSADGGITNDYKSNTFEYVFLTEGTHTVTMSTWKDGTKYIGEKKITIPATATKLVISGFQLNDNNLNLIPLESGLYNLEIDYYNGNEYDYKTSTIHINNTSEGIIFLTNPINLNIAGYFNSSYTLHVRLNKIEPDALNVFKSSNWFLEGANVDAPLISKINSSDNKKSISLIANWMP